MSLFKSFCGKPIGQTSVKIWRCWKCKMYVILRWMRWRWQCGFVIISLQTHPAKLASSWCKAPTLWCKTFCEKFKHLLLSLVLLVLTFSILLLCNCEDDSHLEHHASDQHKDSLKFVEKQVMVFLHMLTVYQSPALYAWTMLHEHLVDFSPIHVCWCLHFSELLAGILSSSKTLKPLQLVHHSMPTSSLLGHLSASECLLVIGAKVIGLLFSPLGSQSRSEWKSSQSTSTTSTACWACRSIWNFSEHHILWHLTWEQFFSVGIKILGYLTWVALKRSVSSRASQCVFFSISGLSLRGQITYTPLSLETYNIVDVILSTVWTRDFFKHPPPPWYDTPACGNPI